MGGPRIVVFDYGSGNVHSATRAFAAAGADVVLTSDNKQAFEADGLVVPGVGAFAACMAQLVACGGDDVIRRRVAASRPVFGICVGHQALFAAGDEHGVETAGVGIYPGTITRLPVARVPHMGWNQVVPDPDSRLFNHAQWFYFVHSYAALATADVPAGARAVWAEHDGVRLVAAVEFGPHLSTQFHPEKSAAAGQALIRAWLSRLGES